jgi:hypothetical protein
MAFIEDLILTLSRSSDGSVGVRVSYTANFNQTEMSLTSLEFWDSVMIYARKGLRDDSQPLTADADLADVPVVPVHTGGNFTAAGAKDGRIARSFEQQLTADELVRLREVGREHPYVVVTLRPVNIAEDRKIAELDIDIGDPGE